MITTLLLIRHGQTDWNNAQRWQGHIDIPLNETGGNQSKLLADRLSNWPIKAVYSSDLQRAAQTAQIVARRLEIGPILMVDLRERHGGIFQGMTASEIHSQFPDALREFQEEDGAPPDGESNIEVAERIKMAIDGIAEDHRGEMAAIVSHGGSLAVMIAYALGFPLGQRARISLRGNTGLSIIEIDGQGPRVTLLNDVNHLSTKDHSLGAGFSFHQPPPQTVESE